MVDHINRNRADNRLINLRKVDATGNANNKKKVKQTRQSILQYALDGKLIKEWNDYDEIINGDNKFRTRSMITNCCIGKREEAYGFIWRYKDHVCDDSGYFEIKYKYKLSNYKINKEGVIINKYSKKFRPFINGGYYHATLVSDNGKSYNLKIHRLVAYTFISKPKNKDKVNHIDKNRKNNNVNNLEWCTIGENNTHSTGKSVTKIDITTGEIIETYTSISEASRSLGKKHVGNGIRYVCNGQRDNYCGYKWKFV